MPRGFCRSLSVAGSVVAAESAEQLQQAEEQVIDAHVQADGSHDVVGFAAVHQLAGLVQDQAGHQQDEHGRHRERQAGHAEEHRGQSRQERDQDADHQEGAHEAEILAGGQGVAGQRQEDRAGGAEGGHDYLAAVWQLQVHVDDRSQREAHEAGEREHEHQTQTAVAELAGQEQQAEVADHRQQQAGVRQVHDHRYAGGQRAEQQRHRQQNVGVANDLVDAQYGRLGTYNSFGQSVHRCAFLITGSGVQTNVNFTI